MSRKIKDLDWLACTGESEDLINRLGPGPSVQGTVPDKLDELIKEVDQVNEDLKGYYKESVQRLKDLKAENARREKLLEELTSLTAQMQGSIDFHNDLHKLLDGTLSEEEEDYGRLGAPLLGCEVEMEEQEDGTQEEGVGTI